MNTIDLVVTSSAVLRYSDLRIAVPATAGSVYGLSKSPNWIFQIDNSCRMLCNHINLTYSSINITPF